MDAMIQVGSRGMITLPAGLRKKYGIANGDVFHLVDLDNVFVLTPMVPMAPELAREIERLRLEAGVNTEKNYCKGYASSANDTTRRSTDPNKAVRPRGVSSMQAGAIIEKLYSLKGTPNIDIPPSIK